MIKESIYKYLIAGTLLMTCSTLMHLSAKANDSEYTTKVQYDKSGFNIEIYKNDIVYFTTYVQDAMFMKIDSFDYNEDGIPDYVYSISYDDHYKIGFLISHDKAKYLHRIYNKEYSTVANSDKYIDSYPEVADFIITDVDDDYYDDIMVNVLLKDDKPVSVRGYTDVILHGDIEGVLGLRR